MRSCRCSCAREQQAYLAILLRPGTWVDSPWVPRKGDYLRATVELVDNKNNVSLTVRVFTKKEEETGDGVEVDSGTTIILSTPGRQLKEWGPITGTGLWEMIRYRFESESDVAGWVLFRMLSPVWFDAVNAKSTPVITVPP